jgi:thiol-disulfide isomerase/thioredoxin
MSRNFYLSISFAVAGIFLFASLPYRANGATTAAPDWQLIDTDGRTVKLSDFKGKVVILNFWAIWCAPCRAEIPAFIALQERFGFQGLTVVGVSVDRRELSGRNWQRKSRTRLWSCQRHPDNLCP